MPRNEYDDAFYQRFIAGSLSSARAVLPEVLRIVEPESVADVGCGLGAWLRVSKELGIAHVRGIDGRHVDRERLLIEPAEFTAVELEAECASHGCGADWGRFDLTMCLEVAEHLPAQCAQPLVAALTRMSDVVLFSAAIPLQGGTNHVNEQWPEYWALMFEEYRYTCLDWLRPLFWTNTDVEWWYAQNMLLFVSEEWATMRKVQPAPCKKRVSLSLVHPLNYVWRAAQNAHDVTHQFIAITGKWVCPGREGNSANVVGDDKGP